MRYYRRVIRIRAEDSPNVQLGLKQRAAGLPPSGEMLVPGVLSWGDYEKRRAVWPEERQCVSLDARFWEGANVLMFPPPWLARANTLADALVGKPRRAKGIGVDPGEGGDDTAMAAVDELGVIELVGRKTPDTDVVVGEVAAFARKHGADWNQVLFDRGGGGKQHADRMRAKGFDVRSVGFGEAPADEPKRGIKLFDEKRGEKERRYAYRNRRAQMYFELRLLLEQGYAIHSGMYELLRQLAPIPLTYDSEGRLELLPKRSKKPEQPSLVNLLGCSPDEADATVLAVHAMQYTGRPATAGVV